MERPPSEAIAERPEAISGVQRMPHMWLRSLWATGLGILAALGLRFAFGWPTPAELFGDQLTALIPLPLFARLLETFGHDAKHWYYGALLLGEGLLTAMAGVAYVRLRRTVVGRWPRLRQRLRLATPVSLAADIAALFLLLWLLSAGILAPLIGGGFFGAGLAGGVLAVFAAELPPHLVYAYAFLSAPGREPAPQPTGAPAQPPAAPVSRRR